jgi:hypothetical protein
MTRENGEVHLIDRENGRVTTAPTLQCVHCGCHWTPQPGSGRVRGFCMECHGPLCGKPGCAHCVHWQQKLDNIAAGLPIDHRPVIVQSVDVGRLSQR